jgi:Uma2 family endonuclease
MTTETLAPIAGTLPAQGVIPPDADWVPVAFPRGAWERWLRRRQRWGVDRQDEVWDGVYMVMPDPNNNHQELILKLTFAFVQGLVEIPEARIFPGINVSDRQEEWTKNYRCPDAAVYLPGNPAEDRDSHWFGGPDFAVEIVSKGDRSRDKFGFYARAGVRELLYIERRPWALELYRRDGINWILSGRSDTRNSTAVESTLLPLSFRLIAAEPRPRIEILGRHGGGPWIA